jgi:hypothetical protein
MHLSAYDQAWSKAVHPDSLKEVKRRAGSRAYWVTCLGFQSPGRCCSGAIGAPPLLSRLSLEFAVDLPTNLFHPIPIDPVIAVPDP